MNHKRRIVMFNRIGPDGLFAADGGAVDWFVPDAEIDELGAESAAQTDTFLFGRKTYDMFAQFWPHALSESATSSHGGGPLRAAQRTLAKALNERTKLVWSTTLERASWTNTRLLRTFDPREIASWKAQPGSDMVVLGSGSIVSQLTEHRLIDEYTLIVSPLFLGHGQPLLRGLSTRVKLELLEARKYASGNALLRYGLAR